MSEVVFIIEEDVDGGYVATALGVSIVTQAETLDELRVLVRDAVRCHYMGAAQQPSVIRLHFVKDEVLAL